MLRFTHPPEDIQTKANPQKQERGQLRSAREFPDYLHRSRGHHHAMCSSRTEGEKGAFRPGDIARLEANPSVTPSPCQHVLR